MPPNRGNWCKLDREPMFDLQQVVPWGRSFDEYRRMFALSDTDLGGRILGCGDGPASFNAEAARRGARVISADPLYQWDGAQIEARIEATYEVVVAQTQQNAAAFVWDSIASVDDLGRVRLAAMREFLQDYPGGKTEGRYVAAVLPELPFADGSFDLAVCSHLLFLYSSQLDRAVHEASAAELCRVAREVRIFPLLALDGTRSVHVDPVVALLRGIGRSVSIETVDYEFQRGGNQMMRITT
jgi:SAM-dependent methyltransferase